MKYREAQTDFFGKRGISWHITVVSRKKKQTNDMNFTDESDDPSDHIDQSNSPFDDSDKQSIGRSSAGKLIYVWVSWATSVNRKMGILSRFFLTTSNRESGTFSRIFLEPRRASQALTFD